MGEPAWQADGSLTFLSDRTGWWNLYRWRPDGTVEPLVVADAEIGVPAWQLGGSRYAVLDGGEIVFARSSQGFDAQDMKRGLTWSEEGMSRKLLRRKLWN